MTIPVPPVRDQGHRLPASPRASRLLPLALVASIASVLVLALPLQPARASVLPAPVSGDLSAFLSRRTLWVVSGAGALAAASLLVENPNTEARVFDTRAFDGSADFGNFYGGDAVFVGTAGLAGAGLLAHRPRWTRAGYEMGRSLVYAGGAVTVLKLTVRRTRPNGGGESFPSGHTAAAFSVAPVLAARFGLAAAIPAYALATATAIGRMEDRKHYLSDVVFGAGIGTAIGLAVASEHGSKALGGDAAGADHAAADPGPADPARLRPVFGLGVTPYGLGLSARF